MKNNKNNFLDDFINKISIEVGECADLMLNRFNNIDFLTSFTIYDLVRQAYDFGKWIEALKSLSLVSTNYAKNPDHQKTISRVESMLNKLYEEAKRRDGKKDNYY